MSGNMLLDQVNSDVPPELLGSMVIRSELPFEPFNPRIEHIRIEDIAHGLSNLCRFAGHSPRFYSVAEHCVRCSWFLKDYGYRKEGLMHDASEAYLCDLTRVVKKGLPQYKVAEKRIEEVIDNYFGLDMSHPCIKFADEEIGKSEMVTFFSKNLYHRFYGEFPTAKPLQFWGWPPFVAKFMFLREYKLIVMGKIGWQI